MDRYVMQTKPSDTFYRAAFDAIALAKIMQILSNGVSPQITFVHDEVTVSVCSDSNLELILRDCERAQAGRIPLIPLIVGPYPVAELSEEELAHDAITIATQTNE